MTRSLLSDVASTASGEDSFERGGGEGGLNPLLLVLLNLNMWKMSNPINAQKNPQGVQGALERGVGWRSQPQKLFPRSWGSIGSIVGVNQSNLVSLRS